MRISKDKYKDKKRKFKIRVAETTLATPQNLKKISYSTDTPKLSKAFAPNTGLEPAPSYLLSLANSRPASVV